jgi:hypothetical protein
LRKGLKGVIALVALAVIAAALFYLDYADVRISSITGAHLLKSNAGAEPERVSMAQTSEAAQSVPLGVKAEPRDASPRQEKQTWIKEPLDL